MATAGPVAADGRVVLATSDVNPAVVVDFLPINKASGASPAVIAPLPMLAKAVYYLISPVEGGADFETTQRVYATDRSLAGALRLLNVVFCVLLIPAVYAVAWRRRGAPAHHRRCSAVPAGLPLRAASSRGRTWPPCVASTRRHASAGGHDGRRPGCPWSRPCSSSPASPSVRLLGAALWRSWFVPAWFGIALMGRRRHPSVRPDHRRAGARPVVAVVGAAGGRVSNEFPLSGIRLSRGLASRPGSTIRGWPVRRP